MTVLSMLQLCNYALILLFGLLLSIEIAGTGNTPRQRCMIFVLFPALLLLQAFFLLSFGEESVTKAYPLITHLPLILILIFICKKPGGVALISVCTAYLCCQIPNWGHVAITTITQSPLIGELCYTIAIPVTYLLLHRYFVHAAHDVIKHSPQSLLLFGVLPLGYYFFDYATTVYSNALYTDIKLINESLPTALVVFYILFLAAYHVQMQHAMQTELQNSMLKLKQQQSQAEMNILRQAETQIRIYQHDMRHHLVIIDELLRAGKPEQASAYIHKTTDQVFAITPKRFCENETVNLLCSFFYTKAEQQNIQLMIDVKIPSTLAIPDAEICALLSNGLENAIHAVAELEKPYRYVVFYCELKQGKLLIEIKNPYTGCINFKNGLPTSEESGHGYGCQSIRAITEQHHGICTFQTENNMFLLRIVLPIQEL